MSIDMGATTLFVMGLIILYVLMWIFIKPVKIALRLILNSIIGTVALMLFNYIGSGFGISIGVNIYTALTCGVLGVPGFILLLLIKWLYGI